MHVLRTSGSHRIFWCVKTVEAAETTVEEAETTVEEAETTVEEAAETTVERMDDMAATNVTQL